MSIPAPGASDRKLSNVPHDVWRDVKAAAALAGKTVTEWVQDAINEKVERER